MLRCCANALKIFSTGSNRLPNCWSDPKAKLGKPIGWQSAIVFSRVETPHALLPKASQLRGGGSGGARGARWRRRQPCYFDAAGKIGKPTAEQGTYRAERASAALIGNSEVAPPSPGDRRTWASGAIELLPSRPVRLDSPLRRRLRMHRSRRHAVQSKGICPCLCEPVQ